MCTVIGITGHENKQTNKNKLARYPKSPPTCMTILLNEVIKVMIEEWEALQFSVQFLFIYSFSFSFEIYDWKRDVIVLWMFGSKGEGNCDLNGPLPIGTTL